jgi:hypothetical protein
MHIQDIDVVFILYLFSIIPIPAFARLVTNAIKSPFRAFFPLREAEVLVVEVEKPDDIIVDNATPLRRTVLLSFISLIEAHVWTVVDAYSIITGKHHLWTGIAPLLIAATWNIFAHHTLRSIHPLRAASCLRHCHPRWNPV